MRYRNVKNGAEIDVPCVVSGPDWEPLDEAPEPKKKAKTKKAAEPADEKAADEP